MGSLLPSARTIDIKLEIFGETSCIRWHQDSYVSRAIVSYTGQAGTEYTSAENVDFWELENGGDNIIKDESKVCAVATGDFFLMKGKSYPQGANGIVHKSPENCYHEDGRVVNRLILKVDVPELRDWEFDYS